ncbi:MAG: hypothetical protein FJX72_05140, partial [Armatimonadetes bacterium]|nr:hypothetical protein [Armatimonadota bacterium]
MAEYQYVALDRSGRQVTGIVTCRDQNDAASRVRGLGYYPVDLSLVGSPATKAAPRRQSEPGAISDGSATGDGVRRSGGQRPSRVHLLLFTRELADLIDAGK